MTEFLQIVAALREQMHATLSRSDVLRALVWPMGILMTFTLGLVVVHAPIWLLATFGTLAAMSTILYGASYIFCLLNDRDSLRSETYSLNKMAIEHGIYGDSRIGIVEAPTIGGQALSESERGGLSIADDR
jgi:hypothetical protein